MCNFMLRFVYCFFFFFKQKTAYEWRISDWSSDVGSSDLCQRHGGGSAGEAAGDNIAPSRKGEAGGVPDKRRIGEPGTQDALVPEGEIKRKGSARDPDDRDQPPVQPRQRLPRHRRKQQQERGGKRQPPEAGGERPDIGHPDHPGSERKA